LSKTAPEEIVPSLRNQGEEEEEEDQEVQKLLQSF
jgi:hypothetical protein